MRPTRAQLAKIHIAKKELGIDEAVYRDILAFNFAVESAKDLTGTQATAMIEQFKARGWKPKKGTSPLGKKKRDGRYIEITPGPAAARQRKVLAMWNELGYGMDKLHSRCMRQYKVERFEWLTDPQALHVLITDLDARIKAMKSGK